MLNEPWKLALNLLGYIVAGGLFAVAIALAVTVLFAFLVWLRLPFLVRRINPARAARQAESLYTPKLSLWNGGKETEYQQELRQAQRQAFVDGVAWARGEAKDRASKVKSAND